MKKNGVLNSDISKVLSDMRHTDQLCIADAGLPIPNGVGQIDISLKENHPSFIEVLKVVLEDMHIQRVYLANEIIQENPIVYYKIMELVDNNIVVLITHDEFKKLSSNSKAIIRTGEMTSYANIILESNVNF